MYNIQKARNPFMYSGSIWNATVLMDENNDFLEKFK